MSALYQELLQATIEELESARIRGVQAVPVSREVLELLGQQPSLTRPKRAAAPQFSKQPDEKSTGPANAVKPTPVAQPNPPRAPAPASEPVAQRMPDKASAMAELRDRALVCVKCPHLVRSRTNVVFGIGDVNSPLMFVGEAPGADEDTQGEPFVGRAGQLLTRIIQTMGLSRETVYIANVLKCRPDTPGQTAGNRKPTPDEMRTCLPYLLAQIELIKPKVIVALGTTAMEGLFGQPVAISKLRGRFMSLRDVPVMPTYHPSYLLRNQSLATKREVWEDMLKVMEHLGMPISEKQQGYFLKAAP